MTGPDILKTSILDLVFENRNKLYGAYALRKYYNQRLLTALGLSFCLILPVLFLFSSNIKNERIPFNNPVDELIVHTQGIPPPEKIPEPPKAVKLKPPPPVATRQFTQIRITIDPVKTTDVPVQADLANSVIANTTTEGSVTNPIVPPTEIGNTASTSGVKADAAPVFAEPQFPGGTAAWSAFLSRHLRAPELLEEGEKKTVLVKFLVGADGLVTAFQVVQSGGAAFDAEVIRVLKKMPRWKPALQNGQPAAVPFTQPVTFMAMGD